MFAGLDLYCTDLTKYVVAAGEDHDDVDRDLSDVWGP